MILRRFLKRLLSRFLILSFFILFFFINPKSKAKKKIILIRADTKSLLNSEYLVKVLLLENLILLEEYSNSQNENILFRVNFQLFI